ncbi:MAG: murein biosynthesis integral membrane protein MurJ, partial [Bdellovibrionota bacterium]|nr:murein biosynthesis integral membrane protein MurJ [Bdellovibrionota bacterium]
MNLSYVLSMAKMAIATFSSRVLGLVREQVMAAMFGASIVTDAFNVAFRIPNVLRDLFAEGVFSSAFVPIFTDVITKDEKKARQLFGSIATLLLISTGIISIGIIIFAPELVSLYASSFEKSQEQYSLAVQLVRIMAPFLTLISLAALVMGVLNTLKVFFMPSLAPAFFNLVMILSIWFLPSFLEKRDLHPGLSMGLGVLFGGVIQLVIQIPFIYYKNFRPLKPGKILTDDAKKVFGRVGIGTIGIAATQINILITTILATGTVVGAVSWLNYAFRLFQFPVGVLSVSIAGSNLVHFSESWKKGEKEKAISFLKTSYLVSFLVLIPSFSLLYSMAKPSIHLIFERGAFLPSDTVQSTLALKMYLLGLPFYGCYKVFAPTFYALDKPRIPVVISMVCIGLNVIFCLTLVDRFGFHILALGTSLSMCVNVVCQSVLLKRLLNLPLSFFFSLRILKIIVAGVVVYLAVNWVVHDFFDYSLPFLWKIFYFCLIGIF